MDHDIFEHLGTSHIVRQGEGSVDFFFGGGGGFRRNGGGMSRRQQNIKGGDYRKLTVSEGG